MGKSILPSFHDVSRHLFLDFTRLWDVLPAAIHFVILRLFFCIFIQGLLEVASIASMSFLALSIGAPKALLEFPAVKMALDFLPFLKPFTVDQRELALAASFGVAILFIIKNFMMGFVQSRSFRLGERIYLYAGDIIFKSYLYMPYISHLAGDSSELFQGLAWRRSLAAMVTSLMNVYAYIFVTILLCTLVVVFTPWIILFVMILLGLIAVTVYKTLKKRTRLAGEAAAEWERAENKVTLNAMRGIRETLIYQQQEVFFNKYRETCKAGFKDRAFLNIAPPLPTWILETSGFVVIFISIFLMIKIDNASMAEITAVVTIIMLTSWRVLPLLNKSLSELIGIQGARHPAMECLKSLVEAKKMILYGEERPEEGFKLAKSIELKNASFSYPEIKNRNIKSEDAASGNCAEKTPEQCLKNISLVIPKGTRIGLVGRSGAGKSTLSLLLSGLAEPESGEMLVDGKALSGPRLAAYRKLVGFVPQNPYIMGGTIAENVAFCQWGLPPDEEKALNACKMAEFDVALERGINVALGQDGAGLSGGQAQRLSIARALYAEPAILIFDEATSALDTGVEKTILKTISSFSDEITIIMIAHRLDTVRNCDYICWLEKGEVVEFGPPEIVLPRYEEFLERWSEQEKKLESR